MAISTKEKIQRAKRERFYAQIDRLDELLSILHRHGGWLTAEEIRADVERYDVSVRTTRRDLEFLSMMGRVEIRGFGKHSFNRHAMLKYKHLGPLFATDTQGAAIK